MGITIVYWVILGLYMGYLGIMEQKMETTIMGHIGSTVWDSGFTA